MSLEPTVFIDLNEFIPQPPKRILCREDPLALDNITIKEEPLDEYLPELPTPPTEKLLESFEFVDTQIKLEEYEATPVDTTTYHDPLAPENFEIKAENYDVFDKDSQQVFDRQNEKSSGCFLSSIFNLNKTSLRQLKLTDEPTEWINVTTASVESTSNLTDTKQLDDVNLVSTIGDLDSTNTVPKKIPVSRTSLNNVSSKPNVSTTPINLALNSLKISDSLKNIVSPKQPSSIEEYDPTENFGGDSDSSLCNVEIEKNYEISNNGCIVPKNEKNTTLFVSKRHGQKPDSPQIGKRRKVCLDSQVNYDKPSNTYRRSRNSLLSALDNDRESESFKSIIEKLLLPDNNIKLESSQDESETYMNDVKCEGKANIKNNMSTEIVNSIIVNKIETESKISACSANEVQLEEVSSRIYPIKTCTVVLERLNLSEINIANTLCVKLSERFSRENVSNSSAEISNKNHSGNCKRMKFKNTKPEIKLNLRTKTSKINNVNLEENEDLSVFDNFIDSMNQIINTSNHITKSKKAIKTKGSHQNKSKINKVKHGKQPRSKEMRDQTNMVNNNLGEISSLYAHNYQNYELYDTYETDDNNDGISRYDGESDGNIELLTSINDPIKVKPIFIINLKEDGRHKVTRNKKVMTQLKRKLIKDSKYLLDGGDLRKTLKPHFKKVIETILTDFGISIAQRTKGGKVIFKCFFCDYSTEVENRFVGHFWLHLARYKCPYCPFEQKWPLKIKRHLSKHGIRSPSNCKVCSFVTYNKEKLKEHINYHILGVNEKNTLYNCEYCSYTTARNYDLRSHKAIWHTSKEKPYNCFYCSFIGINKDSIRRHIRSKHDINKPYFCIYCKFTSTTEESLEEHITTHSKNRPFKCPHCFVMTKREINLRQHVKKHYRQWSSCRKDDMERHIRGKLKFGKNTTDAPITKTININDWDEQEFRKQMYLAIYRERLNQESHKQSQVSLSNELHLPQEQDGKILWDQEIQEYVMRYRPKSKEIQKDVLQGQESMDPEIQEYVMRYRPKSKEIRKDVLQGQESMDPEILEYVLRYRPKTTEIEQDVLQGQEIQDISQDQEVEKDASQNKEFQQEIHLQDLTKSNEIQDASQGQESKDPEIQEYVLRYRPKTTEIEQDVLQGQEIQIDVTKNKEVQQEIHLQDVSKSNEIQDVSQDQEVEKDASQNKEVQQDMTESNEIQDVSQDQEVEKDATQNKEVQQDVTESNEIQDVSQDQEVEKDATQNREVQQEIHLQDVSKSNEIQDVSPGQGIE